MYVYAWVCVGGRILGLEVKCELCLGVGKEVCFPFWLSLVRVVQIDGPHFISKSHLVGYLFLINCNWLLKCKNIFLFYNNCNQKFYLNFHKRTNQSQRTGPPSDGMMAFHSMQMTNPCESYALLPQSMNTSQIHHHHPHHSQLVNTFADPQDKQASTCPMMTSSPYSLHTDTNQSMPMITMTTGCHALDSSMLKLKYQVNCFVVDFIGYLILTHVWTSSSISSQSGPGHSGRE